MKDEILIEPIKIQEYTCKQSKHDIVPKLPLRGILLRWGQNCITSQSNIKCIS